MCLAKTVLNALTIPRARARLQRGCGEKRLTGLVSSDVRMMAALAATLALPGGLLSLIVLFLVLALVAYVLGARGLAGFSMELAKVLIVVFVILAVLALIVGVL
jgi:uncharacterized membrane protein YtjA (UPF0391 family)